MGHHRQIIDRSGGRRLCLYSREPRSYQHFDGLPVVDSVSPHLRRHPLTGDWVGIAAARQGRTFLPNQAECPFCVMYDGGPVTDIPVDAYEVRFSPTDLPHCQRCLTAAGIGCCHGSRPWHL